MMSLMMIFFFTMFVLILLMEKSFMKILILIEFTNFVILTNFILTISESFTIELPMMLMYIMVLGAIFNLLMLILWKREKSFYNIMNMNN